MKEKTREKNQAKPATGRQLEALARAGVTEEPENKVAAQAVIARHYRPRSRRGRRGGK